MFSLKLISRSIEQLWKAPYANCVASVIVTAFNKQYKKLNERSMEDNAQLTSYLVESLNGIQTIKAYNAERRADRETEKRFVRLLRSIFKLSWVGNLQTSLKAIFRNTL